MGFSLVVSPLFNDSYLKSKYQTGRASIRNVFVALVRRLWRVVTISRGCTVIVEYELLPFFPAILERWLVWRGSKMVVDYDDALFHQYDNHKSKWVRFFLGNKIATVMRLSHTVIAGNNYLADYARSVGASHVKIIPTVIDINKYQVKKTETKVDRFVIGWIGSPSTAAYLLNVSAALAKVCEDRKVEVHLVGSGSVNLPGVSTKIIPWDENTEVSEIQNFDVGIMPLPDEPWARGKCGFKLIQYMACGLPVVASPVGVNSEIVTQGVSGLLASTTEEWVNALQRLIDDQMLGRQMGLEGRRTVESRFCFQVTSKLWLDVIAGADNKRSSNAMGF